MQSICFIEPSLHLKPFVRDYAFYTYDIRPWSTDYILQLPALRDHTLQIFLDEIPSLYSSETNSVFSVGRCNILGIVDHSFLDSRMPAFGTRLQVSFQPAGFYHLTGIPAMLFSNSLTDASLVWGNEVNDLVNELHGSPDNYTRAKMIDHFLIHQLRPFSKSKYLADFETIAGQMVHNPRRQEIHAVARQCHKSMRQFERLFKEHVGVSPKKFLCVNRFAYANLLKHKMPKKSWLDVALECGYYDLNHLAKDFKYLGRSTINRFEGYEYEKDIVMPGSNNTFAMK